MVLLQEKKEPRILKKLKDFFTFFGTENNAAGQQTETSSKYQLVKFSSSQQQATATCNTNC